MKTFRINSSYGVSLASLNIVKLFLITEVKRTGNREVKLLVSDLAEKCGISVSTAKKSHLVLARIGTIKMSNKNPPLYIYKGDLGEFVAGHQAKVEQNEYFWKLKKSKSKSKKSGAL